MTRAMDIAIITRDACDSIEGAEGVIAQYGRDCARAERTRVLAEFDALPRTSMDLSGGWRHPPKEAQLRFIDADAFDALAAKLRTE